jgi:PAS domain S-box-containing protein
MSGTPTILTLDDDETSQRDLRHMLQSAGYFVWEARTGESLDLSGSKPDLIVVDMPVAGPAEADLCRRLKSREETSSIPLVRVATHDGWGEDDTGADAILTHPVRRAVLIGVVRALLRLREAEERVRDVAVRWRGTFDAIVDGVCLLDGGGRIVEANRAMLELLQMSWERARGKGLAALLEEQLGLDDTARIQALLTSPQGGGLEIQGIDRGLRLTSEPMPYGMVLTVREEEPRGMVRGVDARLRGLLDSDLIAVFLADSARAIVVDANDAFLRMTGYSRSDLAAGRVPCLPFLPEPHPPGDEPVAMEREYVRRDGTRRPVLAGCTRAASAGSRDYVGFAVDLTRHVRARDDLLSIASHDVKTPLTALQLNIQSILLRARVDPAAALAPEIALPKLDALSQQVTRLGRLLDELLDVSRMRAGHLELRLEPLSLAEVARDIAGRFREELTTSQSVLTVRAEAPARGRWDRTRLEQVISNLLSNAIKYGRGRPIDIEVIERAEVVHLRVRDHGIGIATVDQGRIFRRFERGTAEAERGSFGLGLWIVKRIVDALGGSVWVESTPDHGAIFTVELPRGR